MARMRSLKPEFWHDQEITRLPRDARLLYMAMWNLADEHSRLQGDPRYIKGQAFPYDDDLTPASIDAMVDLLTELGKVERYQVRGAVYLLLPKLAKHQRLDTEKVPSRLPGPDESDPQSESLPIPCEKNPDQGVDESALSMGHVAGGMEQVASGRGNRDARGARIPDDWQPNDDLIDAMRREGIPDELSRRELPKFCDYWAGIPGMKGRKTDWDATWRNWLRRAAEDGPVRGSPGAGTSKAAGWMAIDTEPPLQAIGGTS
jgi:DnaT-like ssDNA binding protein